MDTQLDTELEQKLVLCLCLVTTKKKRAETLVTPGVEQELDMDLVELELDMDLVDLGKGNEPDVREKLHK